MQTDSTHLAQIIIVWVGLCRLQFEPSDPVPITELDLGIALSTMSVFEGCQVTLELDSSLGFRKKTELKKKIIENGGIISFIVTKKVWEALFWYKVTCIFTVDLHFTDHSLGCKQCREGTRLVQESHGPEVGYPGRVCGVCESMSCEGQIAGGRLIYCGREDSSSRIQLGKNYWWVCANLLGSFYWTYLTELKVDVAILNCWPVLTNETILISLYTTPCSVNAGQDQCWQEKETIEVHHKPQPTSVRQSGLVCNMCL